VRRELMKRVDARGLSCPQPVLMTIDAIKQGDEKEIEILVDTDTSRENVVRAAQSQAWKVADIQTDREGYRIVVKK
jgi:TusA-related sulfurtransferase